MITREVRFSTFSFYSHANNQCLRIAELICDGAFYFQQLDGEDDNDFLCRVGKEKTKEFMVQVGQSTGGAGIAISADFYEKPMAWGERGEICA